MHVKDKGEGKREYKREKMQGEWGSRNQEEKTIAIKNQSCNQT